MDALALIPIGIAVIAGLGTAWALLEKSRAQGIINLQASAIKTIGDSRDIYKQDYETLLAGGSIAKQLKQIRQNQAETIALLKLIASKDSDDK